MKFCVENDLSIFEFHDSEFALVSYNGSDLVISASMVNIHKNTPQNPLDCDMEIASANITFKRFHSAVYEPGRVWKTGEDGTPHPVEPRIVYSGQNGIDRFLEELKNKIAVYHFEKEERGYSIGGCGIEPYFTIEFDFDGVTVCWDEYKKKAWYELHRQYRYDVVLHTPEGDATTTLRVNWHEELAHCSQLPSVNIGCAFKGTEYWGHGKDYLWIDAFADLEKRLPKNVSLTCCLTCRHGNFCPVGNNVNEVFCTKDVFIKQKSDLYFYTENTNERTKRLKQYCDFCLDYEPQADGFYTYNEYWDFLHKA